MRVFKRAIQDNQEFKRWEDIKTGNPKDGGKTFNEIKKIWDKVGGVGLGSKVYSGCEVFFGKQKPAVRMPFPSHPSPFTELETTRTVKHWLS